MPGDTFWRLVLPCTLLFFACQDEKADAIPKEVIRPVRVERVVLGGGSTTRTFSGVAKAGTETKLSFRVGGNISDLEISVGDSVRKNALIASLESRDQALQVQEARAGVEQARAQERNAQAGYDRMKALYENSNASQAELDAARTAYDSARQAVAVAQKRLELAQSQAGKTRLTAPVDCKVAKVLVEEGENVQPGQAIAIVNSGGQSEVEIAVPETVIGRVTEGQSASVVFAAVGGNTFGASVTEVGIAPDSTGTTYPVTVTINDKDDRIKSGMAAEVSLRFGEKTRSQVAVSPKAIGEDREGRFAYVAVPTEPGFARVERRAVKTGEIGTDGIEISDGLKVGDLLVTAGLTYLSSGKVVRLPPVASANRTEQPPPPTASASSGVPK